MKRNLIYLFVIAILTISLYSCGSKTIKTETYQFNQKYYLTQDTLKGVLTMDMQVELPKKYKNSSVLKSIRKDIVEKVFGNEYVQYSNKNILSQFANNMDKEYRANNLPFLKDENSEEIGYAYNNDYILEIFSLLNDEHIFSYGTDLYVYMGGAHGLTNRMYYNYNLKNAELITEEDLFTGDYQFVLTELIKQHIIANNPDIHTLEDLEKYYWIEHIAPNDNFYITSESINYVFNPYEIAPYVFGHTEVSIPFSEISEVLRKENPISYLIQE